MGNRLLTSRSATPADSAAIRHVHVLAFGRPHEADLVDALRCQLARYSRGIEEWGSRGVKYRPEFAAV
jgi:predicted N-acetyltransferase YhbS